MDSYRNLRSGQIANELQRLIQANEPKMLCKDNHPGQLTVVSTYGLQ